MGSGPFYVNLIRIGYKIRMNFFELCYLLLRAPSLSLLLLTGQELPVYFLGAPIIRGGQLEDAPLGRLSIKTSRNPAEFQPDSQAVGPLCTLLPPFTAKGHPYKIVRSGLSRLFLLQMYITF